GYTIGWRNVDRVDLALYPVDLTTAISFPGPGMSRDVGASEWLQAIDLSRLEKRASWTHATQDAGLHRPGAIEKRIEEKLAPGAYVLEARAGGNKARDLVLVSSSSVVLKTSADTTLCWFVDALTSEPVADASVSAWEHYYDGSRWCWKHVNAKTAADGTA